MKSYHHILVPIDGSDYAKQALQHAIDIAKLTGASITLLNVANMADIINQFSQCLTFIGFYENTINSG